MRLSELKVRQFRNIAHAEISANPVLNILVGDNGQGKTSIIEGIYYLSALHSFRTAKVDDLIQQGSSGFSIHGRVQDENNSNFDVRIRLEDKKRKLFVNEKAFSSKQFATLLRSVVFSPESLSAIKGGPEARRTLIDQALFQVSKVAYDAQKTFMRALRQRNATLKSMREGNLAVPAGENFIESLEPSFVLSGAIIIEERLNFLDKIFSRLPQTLKNITGDSNSIAFTYQSSPGLWLERNQEDIFNRLRGELNSPERRKAERLSGVTLTGPHRHDMSFLFNGNDSRIFCSQGQQRAIILAFKIAEIVYHSEAFGSYPLLLLDDVLSEFDERKRRFLVEFLRNNEAQTFLTTTDQAHVIKGGTIFQVEAGKISVKQTG